MTRERPDAAAPAGTTASRPMSVDVRRTLLALLASMLGVFPLCELFTDRGWLVDVWLSMIVVVGPAAVLRRRRAPSAGQIWIGVLLLIPWLTINFVRDHAVLGVIPLQGAWHDVGALMTDLHSTTTDQVAPVHTSVAIRLAVCALLGLTAALVDLLAVVGRRGALAGVPLLIVFTVSGAVPRHPVSWVWFALAAAGFLILLALDSSDDLHRWGHYIPRSKSSGRRRGANFAGQRIAVAAIIIAVALPLVIPADSRNFVANLFHSDASSNDNGFGFDQNSGSGSGGIDPFARLRGELIRQKNLDLLHVTISGSDVGAAGNVQPFYMRTNVLSKFTGAGWRPGPSGSTQRLDDTGFGSSPGTEYSPRVVTYQADITVTGLRSNPPLFGSPTVLRGLDATTQWSPQDMLLTGPRIVGSQTITEDVAQPAPTAAELRSATGRNPALDPWLQLPTISKFVQNTTARVIGSAATPYDKARAITNYFADAANGFQYSLTTAAGDSGDDLTDFLTNKVGFCQQYAAAMAVMLRLSGVPSRVVLGYAHEAPDAQGQFTVTSYDAHAWVEAYFEGVGWIPFDPTPLAGISGGAANDLPYAPHDSSAPHATVSDTGRPSVTLPTRATRPPVDTAPVSAAPAASGGSYLLLIVVTIIVVALALTLLVPAAVRWRRRRHRLRLARGGDTEALWSELSDTATDLGYVWSSARTPRQVAAWLGVAREDPHGSLRTITDAVERARYAPSGSVDAPDLTRSLDQVTDVLKSRRSSRERALARFWPASLGWSRVPLVGRWLPGGTPPRQH